MPPDEKDRRPHAEPTPPPAGGQRDTDVGARASDGATHASDRATHLSDGAAHRSDGAMHSFDGAMHPSDGATHPSDGAAHAPAGEAPASAAGAAASSEDVTAPVEETRPSGANAAASDDEHEPAPAEAVSEPSLPSFSPAKKRARPSISLEVLRAYLDRRETQAHLRNVVAGALGRKANRDLVGTLSSNANLAALTSRTLAESEQTLAAWMDGVARNAVRAYFGELQEEEAVFDRGRSLDQRARELTGDPLGGGPLAPVRDETPRWLLSSWLREQVKDHPGERATYDLIVRKARGKRTYEQLAAETGESVDAMTSRVHRLRAKYEPRWEKYKREHDRRLAVWLMWSAGAAVAALLAYLVLRALTHAPPPPPPAPPPALPSATASALPPEPFMPALPPTGQAPLPPAPAPLPDDEKKTQPPRPAPPPQGRAPRAPTNGAKPPHDPDGKR